MAPTKKGKRIRKAKTAPFKAIDRTIAVTKVDNGIILSESERLTVQESGTRTVPTRAIAESIDKLISRLPVGGHLTIKLVVEGKESELDPSFGGGCKSPAPFSESCCRM